MKNRTRMLKVLRAITVSRYKNNPRINLKKLKGLPSDFWDNPRKYLDPIKEICGIKGEN